MLAFHFYTFLLYDDARKKLLMVSNCQAFYLEILTCFIIYLLLLTSKEGVDIMFFFTVLFYLPNVLDFCILMRNNFSLSEFCHQSLSYKISITNNESSYILLKSRSI